MKKGLVRGKQKNHPIQISCSFMFSHLHGCKSISVDFVMKMKFKKYNKNEIDSSQSPDVNPKSVLRYFGKLQA